MNSYLSLLLYHLDDDPFEIERVKKSLEKNPVEYSFHVVSFLSLGEFQEKLKEKKPQIILLDIFLDELDGISLIKGIKENCPDVVIIMNSSCDDTDSIIKSLKLGADDFVSKKSDQGELSLRIANAYQLALLKQGKNGGEKSTTSQVSFAGKTIQQISQRIPLILNSAIQSVYIEGETGTGKEVVADLFLSHLPKNTKFIKVNCGAIQPSLLMSELFGHAKGAFTGANTEKKGLLEEASGGWVFLDEVSSLSSDAQTALLRAIENHEIRPVGSNKTVSIQFKIISATNEPLEKLAKENKFRSDLWQRLCEVTISLPPLRERLEELPDLIEFFCRAMPGGPYQITPPTVEILKEYHWNHGNIRELRNCLRGMTEYQMNKTLTPLSLPKNFLHQKNFDPLTTVDSNSDNFISLNLKDDYRLENLENLLLVKLVEKVFISHPKLSFRKLSDIIQLNRNSLKSRLKFAEESGIITNEKLLRWLKDLEKDIH